MKDISVASHLLSSKMFGVSVRKLLESMGPPLLVPIVLYAIGLPLLVTIPVVVLGLLVGAYIYTRTPPGQRPLPYAAALARHLRGRNEYVWKPPEAEKNDLAYREPFEAWITGLPDAVTGQEETGLETDPAGDCGPHAEWPIADHRDQSND